ncbi:hypothetical protein MA16_Dca007993 [Dendrobium catenatum]|uniref:Uncharacterized protein n=1 Tax=Dendrobium catenatum TaxID=906689 RepID=A0A2I0VL01_9ASPA|nr:hypothetical protein MA16_Dca007993 [Dendrobium catenatum]
MVAEGCRSSSPDDQNTSNIHPTKLTCDLIHGGSIGRCSSNQNLAIKKCPLVITKGRFVPSHKVILVLGKCNEQIESLDKKIQSSLTSPSKKWLEGVEDKAYLEALSSIGYKLKVSRFSNLPCVEVENQEILNSNLLNSKVDEGLISVVGNQTAVNQVTLPISDSTSVKIWSGKQHIVVKSFNQNLEENADSNVVKLDMNKVDENVKLLQNSLVVKVFEKGIPFSLCSIELRHQWEKFGKFHITSLGLDWILCSFHSN